MLEVQSECESPAQLFEHPSVIFYLRPTERELQAWVMLGSVAIHQDNLQSTFLAFLCVMSPCFPAHPKINHENRLEPTAQSSQVPKRSQSHMINTPNSLPESIASYKSFAAIQDRLLTETQISPSRRQHCHHPCCPLESSDNVVKWQL